MKRAILLVLVFVAALGIYLSNGQPMGSFDSAPASLLAFNVLERHELNLDEFRGSYFNALGGQYAFTEAPNGHLTSLFPVGTAILTFPLYAAFYALHPNPPLTSPAFEPARRTYEKVAAALVAALCVVLFLQVALLLGTPFQAGIAAVVYALGTSMWTISSQALWQHGPLNLLLLAMMYGLLQALRSQEASGMRTWLAAAGLCAGFLPVIRPTALVFSVAALAFVIWRVRRNGWPFPAALVLGVTPGIAWNWYFFHTLLGGYSANLTGFTSNLQAALVAFFGLLVSPSKGILACTPVLLFAILGAARALRKRDSDAQLLIALALASGATVVLYAFFGSWWGGYSYGPRFLTDTVAVLALLLVYVIPKHSASARASWPAAAIFVAMLTYSIGVQFAGANSGAAGADWNAIPIGVERDPGRLWNIRDNQVERNLRATYHKDIAWNLTLAPEYLRGLTGSVSWTWPKLQAARGADIRLSGLILNSGTSRMYGYDSGVYVGQARVRLRIRDARNVVQAEQFLYVRGSPKPGERAELIGAITAPDQPGNYVIEATLFALGLGTIGSTDGQARSTLQVTQ